MRTIPVPLEVTLTKRDVARRARRAVTEAGLQIGMTGTLATYPGSIHWHIVKPGETGTLELTYWPLRKLLWFKIHTGRSAGWIEDVLPSLTSLLGDVS